MIKKINLLLIFLIVSLLSTTACDAGYKIAPVVSDERQYGGVENMHNLYSEKEWPELNRFRCDIKGLWGFKNEEGDIAIEPKFFGVGVFSEGLAFVALGDSEGSGGGFIDTQGQLVIYLPVIFEARPFSEGLAAVSLRRWNYKKDGESFIIGTLGPFVFIDRNGDVAISQEFGSVTGFVNGIARVTTANNTVIFINSLGKNAFGLEFLQAQDFIDGRARVRLLDGVRVYIDRNGNIIE